MTKKIDDQFIQSMFKRLYHCISDAEAKRITDKAKVDAGETIGEIEFVNTLNTLLVQITSGTPEEMSDKVQFAKKAIQLAHDAVTDSMS